MKLWFPMPETATGAEVFTLQLAQALSARGIETVVTRYSKQIEAMPWFLSLLKPPAKINLIHLNAGSAAGFFHHGLPTVITGHGAFERPVYDAYKSMPQKLYHAMLMRPGIAKSVMRASTVTAVSSWVADIYRQEYAAPKVEVIGNWVDTDLYFPVRKMPTRKILFVGRTAWQKGSHLLPKIAELLGNEFELTCTLYQNELKGSAPTNMRLIGPVTRDKMPALYPAHDALIVPSIAEGFCLAAAEAMACGLPVFGFRGHGLDDVLGPAAASCNAEMLDLEGMVSTIKNVFDQPRRYHEIADAGRAHVEKNFTEDIALDKYISVYEKVVSAAKK